MSKILIQPYNSLAKYSHLINERNFAFEIVDFAFPKILDTNYQKILREYLTNEVDKNLFYSMHGAVFDLYINSPDSKIKQVSIERIQQCLEIAQKLETKFIVFHTNYYPMMGNESYYRNWVKNHIEFWSGIVDNYNFTILLENMWDYTPKWLAEVIFGVNSSKLKVCFDTGHCNVFSRVPMKKWFEILSDNIVYIHINDNGGETDEENPPGQGNIDWETFNTLVKNYCQNPVVVLEVSDLKKIEESINFLEKKAIYPF
ncbi:MAG TPA: sugar phosphate isomerase/epimerase family protein [candidate division Zixibacteria bacterium]|nr:sugar phosphate isomerase/epimerase family protein [candidate division Zixibacteria bacterium]